MKYSTFVDNGSTGLNYKRKMNQSFAAATWGGIICTWFVLVRLINIKYYCGDVCLFGLNGSPYSEEGVSWSLKKAKLLSVWMERLDGLGGQLVAGEAVTASIPLTPLLSTISLFLKVCELRSLWSKRVTMALIFLHTEAGGSKCTKVSLFS